MDNPEKNPVLQARSRLGVAIRRGGNVARARVELEVAKAVRQLEGLRLQELTYQDHVRLHAALGPAPERVLPTVVPGQRWKSKDTGRTLLVVGQPVDGRVEVEYDSGRRGTVQERRLVGHRYEFLGDA